MPFVARDPEGRITALHADSTADACEELAADDPDLLAFVAGHVRLAEIRGALQASDLDLVRVIEDLIAVLIDNGVIKLTDLPRAAQRKLAQRGALRAQLGGLCDAAAEADEVLLP